MGLRSMVLGCCAVLICAGSAHADSWVKDPRTGCQIWNSDSDSSKDVATWSGGCKDGKASGRGVLDWIHDGELIGTYEGEMENGRIHGIGDLQVRARSGDGFDRMKGSFKMGEPDGYVVFEGANGDRFEGVFEDGDKDGFGFSEDKDGNVYEGQFEDGKPHGFGYYKAVGGIEYFGDFKAGQRDGIGMLIDESGIYLGELDDGVASGAGIFEAKDGSRYHGEFSKGRQDGFGTYVAPNKDAYQGRFVDGKPDGKLLVTRASDGKSVVEIWKNGEKVK